MTLSTEFALVICKAKVFKEEFEMGEVKSMKM